MYVAASGWGYAVDLKVILTSLASNLASSFQLMAPVWVIQIHMPPILFLLFEFVPTKVFFFPVALIPERNIYTFKSFF